MTIPDSTLHRAALAASEAETENIIERCDCEGCMDQRVAGLRAALPVLRAAIRAELVEEMIADAGDAWVEAAYTSPITLSCWLESYLPESETTP